VPLPERTPAQTRAIEARGGDVVVAAGAGSGKTLVLVERFAGLVADGIEPERILTITFTERAAAEMTERIGHALAERGRSDARRALEGAWISTIHGFCARLLREHALEAGVDPAFSVLTDVPAARVRRAALLEAQRSFRATRPGAYDGLVERVRWGKDQDGATSIRRRVLELYDELRAAGASLTTGGTGTGADEDLDALWHEGVQAAFAALAGAVACLVAAAGAQARLTSRTLRQVAAVRAAADEVAAARLDAFRPEVWHALDRLARACQGEGALAPELGRARLAAQEAGQAYAEGPSRALGRGLEELLVRFDAALRREKAGRSLLDFADLEERAGALLGERPDVREAVQSRFDAVLVDEFQDTSRIQQKIVDLVRRPRAFFAVGDVKQSIYGFRHAEVRGLLDLERTVREEGGEVVALDVSFRTRPEVLGFVDDVFQRAWAEPGSEVPHQPLRAGAPFGPSPSGASGPTPVVEVVVGRGEVMERARAHEARAVAARLAAVVEGKLVHGTNPLRKATFGEPLRYRDCAILLPATTALAAYERALRERGVPYKVAAGRGFYGAREVVDAVALLQVAASAHDDLALATVLRSPAVGLSDEALLALAEHAQRRRLQSLLEALAQPEAVALEPLDHERCRKARALVLGLRRRRGRWSTRQLLEWGLERSGLLDGALLRQGDLRGAANLHKLLGIVDELEREGSSSPAEVAAILADLRASGAREAEANVAGDDEDAVSVMTVHAAKGLEWPLVVVADLGRGTRSDVDAVAWTPEAGVVVALRDPARPDAAMIPLSLARQTATAKARSREESKRLLYVAMTRAQDQLVLAGAKSDRATRTGDWLTWVQNGLGARRGPPAGEQDAAMGGVALRVESASGIPVRRVDTASDLDGTPIVGPVGPAAGARPVLDAARAAALARGERPALPAVEPELEAQAQALLQLAEEGRLPPLDQGTSVTTISEVVTWATCPRKHLLEHVVGDLQRDDGRADGAADDALRAAGWDSAAVEPSRGASRRGTDLPADVEGIVVHEVLAHTLGARPSPTRVAERLAQLAAERGVAADSDQLEGSAARALSLARSFERTELGLRAHAAPVVTRERPFLVGVPGLESGGHPLLLRGQTDLLFHERRGSGWVLVDYKASEVTAFEVPERLDPPALQTRLYAVALEALGERVAEAHVAFLVPEMTVKIDVGPNALAGTRRLLARFVDARRRLEAPATPGAACRTCSFRKGCTAGQAHLASTRRATAEPSPIHP
jgi:ATP-dependent helicase/nuclease subunit A